MDSAFKKYFDRYSLTDAPFMHLQHAEWANTLPLSGLRVVHHVPLVPNTLLKIACLIEAGADVTVTNPFSFCQAHPDAVTCLNEAGVTYADNLSALAGDKFDLYFDCGAELFQALGSPNIGAIELTGSGDQLYRKQNLDFPVVSIDQTLTKQLETVFGCAESSSSAICQLTGLNPAGKSWLVFGFGKIGRGVSWFCVQNQTPLAVVEPCPNQRLFAKNLGIHAIDPVNMDELKQSIDKADIVITATGKKAALDSYPHAWFQDKILANLGIYDEYGPSFSEQEILNNKKPVNFILDEPTPVKYIDPEFYLHNHAALLLLQNKMTHIVHGIPNKLDRDIINRWCACHSFSVNTITSWFIRPDSEHVTKQTLKINSKWSLTAALEA